jgi:hypothetical protein
MRQAVKRQLPTVMRFEDVKFGGVFTIISCQSSAVYMRLLYTNRPLFLCKGNNDIGTRPHVRVEAVAEETLVYSLADNIVDWLSFVVAEHQE